MSGLTSIASVGKSVLVEVEFDLDWFGGDYSLIGQTKYVYVREDQIDDEHVRAAFAAQTGYDPVHIIHWRLVDENEEEIQARQMYFSDLLGEMEYPDVGSDATIDERFDAFHDANPHVAQALIRMALDLKRRGIEQYGMKALYEALRYQVATETGHDEFKLNNNYTSRYARLLMELEPELRGFFETRVLRS